MTNPPWPPERPDEDIDAAFAAIVAGWDAPPSQPGSAAEHEPPSHHGEPPSAEGRARPGPGALPTRSGPRPVDPRVDEPDRTKPASPEGAGVPSTAADARDDGHLDAGDGAVRSAQARDTLGPVEPRDGGRADVPALPPAPPEPRRPSFSVAPPGWRVHIPDPAADDEPFEQPDPPLPRADWVFWAALLALVLGPLALIVLAITQPYGDRLPLWVAGAVTVGGFVLVVSRLPERRDDDDDGARV